MFSNNNQYETILDEGEEFSVIQTAKSSAKYLAFLAVLLGFSFLLSEKLLTEPDLMQADLSERKSDSGLYFSFQRNGYDPISYMDSSGGSDLYKYLSLSKYMGVIEPNVENNLYVGNLNPSSSTYTFKYTVCPYDPDTGKPDTQRCETGRSSNTDPKTITVKCDPYDAYEVKINQYYDEEGTNIVSNTDEITGAAVCMRVRRDIKSLTTDDLAATMDAMYQMWDLTEEEGQKLYGDDFHSIDYFVNAHMYHTAQKDADHMNEGIGFISQHVKLTELFEKSMQAVDETVNLPYWDYTAETGSLTDSYMFTADTFGTIKTPMDETRGWVYGDDSVVDGQIQDGRWEKVKATVATTGDAMTDPFGMLRGSWSMNPSPYVSRYTTSTASLPTCSDFYSWIQVSDFADFLEEAAHTPHDAVKSAIGGTYGCDKMDSLTAAGLIRDSSAQLEICQDWSSTLKDLYRDNYLTPKSDCVTGVFYLDTSIKCGFKCDDSQKDDMLARMKELLGWEQTSTNGNIPGGLNSTEWDKWYDFTCSGDGYRVFSGDHMYTSAVSDPSYWLVHPNIERLLQAKMMAGGFLAVDWPKELPKICDKSTCYEEDYGVKDEYKACCNGHFEGDQMLDFVTRNSTIGIGATNREIMVQVDPSSVSYLNAYVYEDLSWSHCEEDFASLMEKMLDDARRR